MFQSKREAGGIDRTVTFLLIPNDKDDIKNFMAPPASPPAPLKT